MKKIQKLKLKSETVRVLSTMDLKRVGGAQSTMLPCNGPTVGYTVCLCLTDVRYSCPCQLTAFCETEFCEPSYRICG